MSEVRVGISGWRYPPWRGVFYPPGLPQRRELEHASRRLTSIEINGSFYALQRPEGYRSWHAATPDGFMFAVKGGRFITHMKKLRGVETAIANFFASGVLALGDKLGPFLWQLPPNLGFDAARIDDFLAMLPRTTTAAARLATQHDEKVEGRAWTVTDAERQLRHAVEVRHATYVTDDFLSLLAAHEVAVVTADTAGKWPMFLKPTTDLAYVRLHGAEELYVSGYDDAALDLWAGRVAGWRDAGCDVVVYFDNDAKVHAPFDAERLLDRLGLRPLAAPTDQL
ncbi:MAG TPA: DUF72 domain-containing protein [Nonomuraea sp.]|nr:DUF72 domain-containing protein [Nonomuraea sp.]